MSILSSTYDAFEGKVADVAISVCVSGRMVVTDDEVTSDEVVVVIVVSVRNTGVVTAATVPDVCVVILVVVEDNEFVEVVKAFEVEDVSEVVFSVTETVVVITV